MKLDCYVFPEWTPNIRPASSKRDWMDASPEAFAYRCLPLAIANAHGWEILSPCGFEAEWNGGPLAEDVTIHLDNPDDQAKAPVALFGQASITFHIQALLRTEEGVDLWLGGPPNQAKDGIAPLNGIIETDWSPYSFTMNWRFTRPHHKVRFEAGEPIAFFFPIMRHVLEEAVPTIKFIDENPVLKQQFTEWSQSRDAFVTEMRQDLQRAPTEKWQKLYFRGLCPNGSVGSENHRTKVRAPEFSIPDADLRKSLQLTAAPTLSRSQNGSNIEAAAAAKQAAEAALSRAQWMDETKKELAKLNPDNDAIFRISNLSCEDFLLRHYSANWPVVLPDKMDNWPALSKWTPDYLRAVIGSAEVEVQTRRSASHDYELQMMAHKEMMSFDQFLNKALDPNIANDCYMTAYNAQSNQLAMAPLASDMGVMDGILDPSAQGMIWIGGAGTFTPLHHDLTNNLLLQLCGRKKIILVAPEYRAQLYNSHHVYSDIRDISQSDISRKFPLLDGVTIHEIILGPGDALFIPIGWWHQVTSLDFSVSITHTKFKWRNDFHTKF